MLNDDQWISSMLMCSGIVLRKLEGVSHALLQTELGLQLKCRDRHLIDRHRFVVSNKIRFEDGHTLGME